MFRMISFVALVFFIVNQNDFFRHGVWLDSCLRFKHAYAKSVAFTDEPTDTDFCRKACNWHDITVDVYYAENDL